MLVRHRMGHLAMSSLVVELVVQAASLCGSGALSLIVLSGFERNNADEREKGEVDKEQSRTLGRR